jgi:hypothetical protein
LTFDKNPNYLNNETLNTYSQSAENLNYVYQINYVDERNQNIKELFDSLKFLYNNNQIDPIFEDDLIRENLITYFILSDLYSFEKDRNNTSDYYLSSLLSQSIPENNRNNKHKLNLTANENLKIMLHLKSILEKKNIMNKILYIPQNKFRQNPKIIELNKSLLMAIINCTPDSIANAFLSDNQNLKEKFCDKTFLQELENCTNLQDDKYDKIINLLKKHKNSIDIVDIGGESTRPNSDLIDDQTEFERVEKLITRIRNEDDLKDLVISVDTRKVRIYKFFSEFSS